MSDPGHNDLEAKRLGINTSNPAILSALARGEIDEAIEMSQTKEIEAYEAAGAAAMRSSNRLPIKGLLEHREALEQMGFVFGDKVDNVLVAATLPQGWYLEENNPHDSRHMALRDEQGRQRGHVFIKTVSYDYKGYVSWNTRFKVNVIVEDGRYDYELEEEEEASLVGVVMDSSTEIYRTEPQCTRGCNYEVSQNLTKKARQWLMEQYPNASDPFEYWSL